MSQEYHIVQPVSSKTSYGVNDHIDFNISMEGRQMLQGSFRIEGQVVYANIPNSGGSTDYTKDFNYDGTVGAHGLFSHMIVSADNFGSIDENPHYPLVVKAKRVGTVNKTSLSCESPYLSELCFQQYILSFR